MSLFHKHVLSNSTKQAFLNQVRHSRIKPFMPVIRKNFRPQLYFSLKERLAEKDEALKDPELYKKINIGLAYNAPRDTEKWKILQRLKSDDTLEEKARNLKLQLDLDVIEAEWISSNKPLYLKSLAENSDIYNHLFGDYAFFIPVVHMDIFYDFDDESVSPVHAGNLLKPKETTTCPSVSFESKEEDLWTLVMTNPDGNLYDNGSEILHWFVGNIPGGEVKKGDVIMDYMRPIPPKGTGYHRFCFVLYKQNGTVDFSQFNRNHPCLNLRDRTFRTFEFYKQFEDNLTPAGLSWFQADYDQSLINFFHKQLQMLEPIFEYEFPKPYVAPQRHFPMLRPFNRYMDLHRDPKDMQKLMLLKRLARVHPFQGEKPLLPFPQAVPIDPNLPIWQKNEIRAERDGKGKYRDMYRGDDRPYIEEEKLTSFPFSDLK